MTAVTTVTTPDTRRDDGLTERAQQEQERGTK